MILYTYGLRGDLDRLPRLYTWMTQLDPQAYRVDLGESCDPAVWPCAITGGRSTLMILDAMGYHAARADLAPGLRERTQTMMGLVDASHTHIVNDVTFSLYPVEAVSLNVILQPADDTCYDGRHLYLAPVRPDEVGVVRLNPFDFTVHTLPPGTLPDPTIAGTVDFVRDEARYLENKGK